MEVCVRILNIKFGNTVTPKVIETGELVNGYVMLDPTGDPATCPYVIGKRTAVYQEMPADVALDPANVALAWSASFSLVIVCYLVSRSAGAILNFLRTGGR